MKKILVITLLLLLLLSACCKYPNKKFTATIMDIERGSSGSWGKNPTLLVYFDNGLILPIRARNSDKFIIGETKEYHLTFRCWDGTWDIGGEK